MKYEIWLPDDTTIEVDKHICHLNEGDIIYINKKQYVINNVKEIDYDDNMFSVGVDYGDYP